MDISKQEAQDSLEQIRAVSVQTRKAIASSYASRLLILWGLIWSAAFVGTHFFLARVWLIWTAHSGIGIVGTILICRRQSRLANATRISAASKVGWRIFWFWALLYIYLFIWLSILKPQNGLQLNAFICTACMFAYIALGFWLESYFMVWLGLGVTAITLVGLYVLPGSWYCLWMAAAGGGAIWGTGLYIRVFWK